jgi:hypothetical protein
MRLTITFHTFKRLLGEPYGEHVIETRYFTDFNKVIEYTREKHIRNNNENYYIKRIPHHITLADGKVLLWSEFTQY